jgi:D-beta-D-heptose 7-phosphate kinase/D-beta-D-heptose 1-phosphate adenosyltransferase
MIRHFPLFNSARVLVAGDIMLDRYWFGTTTRISPEAPVPVVRVEAMEERPGGAANVAMNVVSLGAQATLLGITGADEAAESLERQLALRGVECVWSRPAGFTTVTKLRVLSQHQQLIRLDFEEPVQPSTNSDLLENFKARLHIADVVVLSDYAKGCLQDPAAFIARAREAGKPVIVDPKSADFSRYRGATLVTPNLKEFQMVAGNCADESALVEKARELCEQFDLSALLVTRGEHGMTLVPRTQEPVHLPARAREVFDVTGAGDTVVAVLAASLAAGHDLVHATALANTAAGIVVGKLGAATVTLDELHAALHEPVEDVSIVLDEESLLAQARAARLRGETIVMTNGCFDILHAGHIHYLTEAKKLGDRLIVAVNDDASVARLKGPSRPVNPLEQRMAVLAGLKAVDWVVPFSEDTPQRLICRVLPDVLVKGGDYTPEQVAGGDCVVAAGGKVRILNFVEGCSSSKIIESVLRSREP